MKEKTNANISILTDIYGSLLSDRQREFVRLFYDYDNSLAEIASQYNVSRQAVFDALNKAVDSLDEFESKLRLCEKYGELKSKLTALYKFCDNEQRAIINDALEILGE